MSKSTKPTDSAIQISQEFLLGELLAVFWARIKSMPVVWGNLPQGEQEILIDSITSEGKEAVRQAVHIIASDARPVISADVDSVTFKDGIKVTLKVSKDAAERLELADSVGTMVLIVLPHAEKHIDAEGGIKSEDDNKTLFKD